MPSVATPPNCLARLSLEGPGRGVAVFRKMPHEEIRFALNAFVAGGLLVNLIYMLVLLVPDLRENRRRRSKKRNDEIVNRQK